MQLYVKTTYPCWYSIGESNTEQSGPGPLQEGGFSHSACECNIKCNKNAPQIYVDSLPWSHYNVIQKEG